MNLLDDLGFKHKKAHTSTVIYSGWMDLPKALSASQVFELCKSGNIPENEKRRFINAVESAVAGYRQSKSEKLPIDVEREFQIVLKLVEKALALRERKTWRPGEFHQLLDDISQRLSHLSERGQDYLKFRNSSIIFELTEGLPNRTSDVIDPVAAEDTEEQLLALQYLHGVLHGPVARVNVGRPPKGAERALYHFIAAAYAFTTGKTASDTSPNFMAVCEVIKHCFKLDDWNPASCARIARNHEESDI